MNRITPVEPAAAPGKARELLDAFNGGQVNLVQPATIRTTRLDKLFAKLWAEAGITAEARAGQLPSGLRIPRLGEPADVANLVTVLCRAESRWIHGTILDVDGGQNKSV